jgi:pilus assembly protein Flp/PilA
MGRLRVKERFRDAVTYWRRNLPPDGQGLVEYALIIMFVAMIVLVVLFYVGPAVGNIFSNIIPQL